LPLILIAQFATHAFCEAQSAVVREVLSGDTVRLSGGKILKYTGLRSPAQQDLIVKVREYGEAAAQFNGDLVQGKPIRIEWDLQLRNSRGELLGYVFLEDGTFVNEKVLREGHAKLALIAPNLKYAERLQRAELAARRERKGLWVEEPKNPYLQKEFIGDTQKKIFYFSNSPEVESIPGAHRAMFSSRVDAVAAGYRPSEECRRRAPTEE